jgi:hypothetical protein
MKESLFQWSAWNSEKVWMRWAKTLNINNSYYLRVFLDVLGAAATRLILSSR